MHISDNSAEEERRLQDLDEYRIMDTGHDPRFMHIAKITRKLLASDYALISIVDKDRQWWKANIGLPEASTPSNMSFPPDASFSRQVVNMGQPLIVADALCHPVFCSNSLVTGPAKVRSYLGAPLTNKWGYTLGALGVYRTEIWTPTVEDIDLIGELAWIAMDELELHRTSELALKTARMLANSEEEYRATFERAPIGIAHVGLDGSYLRVNDRFCKMIGYDTEELLQITSQEISYADDLELELKQMQRIIAGQIDCYEMEKQYCTRGGGIIWVLLNIVLRRSHNNQPLYFISMMQEITARKRAEERSSLLVGELNHRIKNTIATVASVAIQSARFSNSIDEFRENFGNRVEAIATAHRLLNDHRWDWVLLHELIEEQAKLGASSEVARIRANGPELRIQAQVALYLGLILHELTTNSCKHGSLAREDGSVDIDFRTVAEGGDRNLVLSWVEFGGTSFDGNPRNQGFGAFLIDRGLRIGLQGSVEFLPSADGFSCKFFIPLRERPELLTEQPPNLEKTVGSWPAARFVDTGIRCP